MLNKPAVVPATDDKGIVKEIVGVDPEFVTVEVNVLPLALTVNALTSVTVPPVPVADNSPVVEFNDKPDPIEISPGAAAVFDLFPNNLCPVISAILFKVTAEFAIVVVSVPAVVVISPVSAGNLAAPNIPVALVPDKLTAFAVKVWPDNDK